MATPLMDLTSDLNKFLTAARSAKYLIVDTEGNGRDVRDRADNPVTMGSTLTFRDRDFQKQSYYFAFEHIIGDNQPEYFDQVRDLLREHPCLVMHNAKHDLIALELWDVRRFHGFYCTMTMAHLINENQLSYRLDHLSRKYGGEPKAMTPMLQKLIDFLGWDHVPVDIMRDYSNQDGYITLELFEKLYLEFCAQGYDGAFWHKEEKWIWAISQMEKVGIRVDSKLCQDEIVKGEKILEEIKSRLGLNPSSANDLHELLINQLKLPVVKFTDGGKKGIPKPSFDKEAMKKYEPMLEKMGSAVAQDIVTYRGWQKVVSTNHKPYLRLQGKDGRIHPNYKIHGTKTGRLSSGSDSDGKTEVKSPNFQNIPKESEKPWDGKLKQAFIAAEGYTIWEIDQSQAEMRVGTAYSGDPKLLEIFENGLSLFDQMAIDLRWPRQDCKTFVYATGYGAQDERIAGTFGIPIYEASDMRNDFNRTYATYVACKEYVSRRAQKRNEIKYWSGRRRHFQSKWEAKKLAFNSLMQGGVAELIKWQAIEIAEVLDWDTCRMLLQVHDSLGFEIKNGYEEKWIPIIKKIMETPPPLFVEKTLVKVPFAVDVKKWGTNEKWQRAA